MEASTAAAALSSFTSGTSAGLSLGMCCAFLCGAGLEGWARPPGGGRAGPVAVGAWGSAGRRSGGLEVGVDGLADALDEGGPHVVGHAGFEGEVDAGDGFAVAVEGDDVVVAGFESVGAEVDGPLGHVGRALDERVNSTLGLVELLVVEDVLPVSALGSVCLGGREHALDLGATHLLPHAVRIEVIGEIGELACGFGADVVVGVRAVVHRWWCPFWW